jgi:hypothetical protein
MNQPYIIWTFIILIAASVSMNAGETCGHNAVLPAMAGIEELRGS